jgi:hypothetical protein
LIASLRLPPLLLLLLHYYDDELYSDNNVGN